MSSGPRGSGQRGLTLVEVIVAMAVLSLIVLVLGASLRGISQSAQRVDQRVAAIDEMRVAVAFLRDLFARTVPVRASGPERRLMFDAGATSVSWVGVMPARFGSGGRHAFRLEAEPLADGSTGLVLRYLPWAPDSNGFPDWSAAESRVLVHQVDRVSLAYGGEGMSAGWQEAWGSREQLPPRLRVDLGSPAGDWPTVILPVRQRSSASEQVVFGGTQR